MGYKNRKNILRFCLQRTIKFDLICFVLLGFDPCFSCVTVAVEIALVRFICFDFPGENIIKRFLKDVCINVSIIVFAKLQVVSAIHSILFSNKIEVTCASHFIQEKTNKVNSDIFHLPWGHMSLGLNVLGVK